jgi:hypothetical protein
LGMLGEQFGYAGLAVWVCWVSSLCMLGERERERERIDWVCVSSLGMLGGKEWEAKRNGKIERGMGRRE